MILFKRILASDERICFGGGGSDCDVLVIGSCVGECDSIFDVGVVSKTSGDFPYVGNLMYAAIFSNKAVYDCNVERLLFRTGTIADIFAEKTDLMDARDCGSNLKGDLIAWGGMLEGGGNLMSLKVFADALDKGNGRDQCKLW